MAATPPRSGAPDGLPPGYAAGACPGGFDGHGETCGSRHEPADQINPAAVEAMREVGIDIAAAHPKVLTTEAVQASDAVITMGCGDACPFYPGKRYEDWKVDDPAGQGLDAVRPIRDDIEQRVRALLSDLVPSEA